MARRKEPRIPDAIIDQLLAGADPKTAFDPNVLLDDLKKALPERELGWRPNETFETGLRKTVQWYLDNPAWWQAIRSGAYRGERLGLIA